MPKPYSIDLRGRVIEEVKSGASRREAAVRYGLSPSVVVIWVQRFRRPAALRQSRVVAASRRWRSRQIFCWD
jgi:transposase